MAVQLMSRARTEFQTRQKVAVRGCPMHPQLSNVDPDKISRLKARRTIFCLRIATTLQFCWGSAVSCSAVERIRMHHDEQISGTRIDLPVLIVGHQLARELLLDAMSADRRWRPGRGSRTVGEMEAAIVGRSDNFDKVSVST